MVKVVDWIEYDESSDIREVRSVSRGKVVAILNNGSPLHGWGGKTHTVLAQIPNRAESTRTNTVFDVYTAPAHAKLSKAEIKGLPVFGTIRQAEAAGY